jgi:signal transduction histidine kinase
MTSLGRSPNATSPGDMRLAKFIRTHTDGIVADWISFARTKSPASQSMTKLALQDHILEILDFVANDLETPQTQEEQVAKSKGEDDSDGALHQTAAQIHAALRLEDGFNIDQVVSEYRALRASVVKQWTARNQALANTDLDDLTRFNESIDQALAESVAEYTRLINDSRALFLGVLGHDLRNPIGAATMAARVMVKMGPPEAKQTLLASQIVNTTERANQILDDLLEVTRTAFGTDIPIVRTKLDVAEVAQRLVEEMRSLSPTRRIELDVSGDTSAEMDGSRLGQVFSNLIGNALQYGAKASVVRVTVAEQLEHLSITVHNDGDPIPSSQIGTIFESLTRGHISNPGHIGSTNLGLGLFVTKKIVIAHRGEISVNSSLESGTTFSIVIPKR